MKKLKIVIFGGGTAGWLTALYLNKYFSTSEITLIESDKIGVLGAGEGSTPHLLNTLRGLNIDFKDLIKKTGGTIKNGISFENWNGDNKNYFHGFTEINYSYTILDMINKNIDLSKNTYSSVLSYNNEINLSNTNVAIHFDAPKIAEYLKEVGLKRGIILQKGEFLKVDNKKEILTKIYLKNGWSKKFDFIFDCSGFSRLLIGKHYKTEWIDYSDYLTVNTAMPWEIKQDKDPKPYTQAIAMENGWVWKIPLQHRFGSGYIYDSNFTNEDQILKEAEKKFKTKIKPIKTIKFNAGRFKDVWKGNCIAIGLSSGFTEPLEATSIWLTIIQLNLLEYFLSDFVNTTEKSRMSYNEHISKNNENVLAFLYLHYLTKRKDSKFWKTYKERTKIPKSLENIYPKIIDGTLNALDVSDGSTAFFEYVSFLIVSKGLGIIEKNKNMEFYNIITTAEKYKELINTWKLTSIKHSVFLKQNGVM